MYLVKEAVNTIYKCKVPFGVSTYHQSGDESEIYMVDRVEVMTYIIAPDINPPSIIVFGRSMEPERSDKLVDANPLVGIEIQHLDDSSVNVINKLLEEANEVHIEAFGLGVD